MAEASSDLKLPRKRVGSLKIELLANETPGRSTGDARDHAAARIIKSVGGIGQPPGAVFSARQSFGAGVEFHASAQVFDVLPAHLIRQAVLIVTCWVELIERAAAPITWIAVAGGVVVFGEEARSESRPWNRVSSWSCPGRRGHRRATMGRERSTPQEILRVPHHRQ